MSENNHIEEFFKNRLASQDFSFQEDDWLKMERKLNTAGISPAGTAITHFSLKTIILIVAALTAAFILGWIAREIADDKKNSGELQKNNQLPHTENSVSVPQLTTNENSKQINQSQSHMQTERLEGKDLETSQMETNSESAHENSQPQGSPENSELLFATSGGDLVEDGNDKNSDMGLMSVQGGDAITQKGELITSAASGGNHRIQDLLPVSGNEVHTLHVQEVQLKSIPLDYSHELRFTTFSGSDIPLSALKPFSRWSVGLLLAPDFNSTGVMQRKSFSPVAGGLISYSISSRWSLSMRILYNNKKYSSTGEDYQVPYYYWSERTNGIVPDNIDASCRVLDIPVLLTYKFYNRQRLSLSVSAGPGSYFLLDEKYKFTFRQDNPGADTQWQTKENSRVLFGIANLAAGIELHTGRKTSIGLEPYLKIPLKEMGWANVNLSGMGLLFSFQYHF